MIEIRALKQDDWPAWKQLWHGYLAYYETALPEEIYKTTFSRLIGGEEYDFKGLLAIYDGTPVGLTHYLFHRHGWKIENCCYLQDLFTAPEARGLGVGRKLIEAVYEQADLAGAPSVYWLTQDFNKTARKLYDQVGVLTPFVKYQRPL